MTISVSSTTHTLASISISRDCVILLSEKGIAVNRHEDLVDLLDVANPVLVNWLEVGAERLAQIIPTIAYVVDPEAIIFGGRLPDALIDALMEEVGQRGFPTTS